MRVPINWKRVILGGLIAGAIINAIEYTVHGILLREEWTVAFNALGKSPLGWSMFIPSNFLVGIFGVWGYTWIRSHYDPGVKTALRAAMALWIIFWIIPIMGLIPLDLFPNTLLFSVIAFGLLDSVLGTVVGAWMYKDSTVISN